jgi:hypothetical protein
MTLLLLAAALIGFILIFKAAQRSTPVSIEPLSEGPLDAVEFFWRPG